MNKPQHGMTLIELMISMLLSLGLIAGIGSLFVQMQKSNKIQRSVSSLADDGSYAQKVLKDEIRTAGRLRSAMDTKGTGNNVFLDSDPLVNDLGSTINLASGEYIKGDSVGGNDQLMIRYQIMDENDLRSGDTGSADSPCTQNVLMLPTDDIPGPGGAPATTAGDPADVIHVVSVWFYLHGNTLMCQAQRQKVDSSVPPRSQCLKNCNVLGSFTDFTPDAGIAPVVVISNVQKLVLTYGVDSDGDNAANYYVAKADVPAGRWKNIVSLRMMAVVRGDEKYIRDSALAYQLEGVSYSPADERQLYKVFTTSIALRNQLM
jgi:type IV pilus assembly protein PilW